MKKNSWSLLLLAILCLGAFCWCFYRDIQLEKQNGGDLRNRVVGARLQMDGKLPYLYNWKPADGLRYYDPLEKDTTYANGITASPFFHHLLYPIANLPQRQISRIWLAVQYALVIACMLIALSFTKTNQQRWAVAITGTMFLFTTAWLTHIYFSQIYIVYPFLCLAFIFFFRRQDNLFFSFFAGLTAIALVLSRPTMILFFLPFLLLLNRYSLKYLFVFFTPVIVLLSYFMFNKTERNFWIDYKKGIAAQIKDHESGTWAARNKAFKPILYQYWEGWSQDSIKKERRNNTLHLKNEFSAVRSLAGNIFHKEISSTALSISFAIITALLLTLFGIKRWNDPSLDFTTAALFGFCLYMLSDLFSPIIRSQYYTTQWIFPLLFCASFYDKRNRIFHLLLMLGLVLIVLTISQIKMRHTLGEYLILFTLLWFSLFARSIHKPVEAPYKDPSF